MPVSMKSWWMSFSRQGVLFSRYSDPPSRKTRRVMVTSFQSSPSSSSHSAKVIETSAMPSAGARVGAGEDDVGHFPTAQRLGRLLAEHPADRVEHVGFAAAVRARRRRSRPRWKLSTVLGAKDLKPKISSDLEIHREV